MLQEIVSHKKVEVNDRKSLIYLSNLKSIISDLPAQPGFIDGLEHGDSTRPRLIAEVKKQSPSAGILRDPYDPLDIAHTYKNSGASALSVLTDRLYFQGSLDVMAAIAAAVQLPVLDKEFVVDELQCYEARAYRASAILLIAAILEPSQMMDYASLARELALDVLVEVHTEAELETVLGAMPDVRMLGLNNRNLFTFTTDLSTTSRLAKRIPDAQRKSTLLVSESGIRTREDVARLAGDGVHAVLVGETLLKARNIGAKVRELIG